MTHYRDTLSEVFNQRLKRQPAYSLRAFARDLKVKPSAISMVLSGKRGLSVDMAAQIAQELRLSMDDSIKFLESVEKDAVKSDAAQRLLQYRSRKVWSELETSPHHLLEDDLVKRFSDWYYPAILELAGLRRHQASPHWIAKKFRIHPGQARDALSRLERLGLLEVRDNQIHPSHPSRTTSHNVPSKVVRDYTRLLLDRADEALEQQNIEQRDFGTYAMPIDRKNIPKAKKMIRSFRRNLAQILSEGEPDDVYLFSTQLFQLVNPTPSSPPPSGAPS